MRSRSLLAAAAAAGLGLLAPATAQASHSWGGYHWARTSNPFTLKLGDNVSAAWDASLSTASADWSASTVLDTAVVAGSTPPKKCRATTGRVEVCSATYGRTGWLGIASISLQSGSHISQGTVKLNDTYFNTPTYNTRAWRNLVTCQEIGHTLGLDHQDEVFDNANLGTCMDYTNSPESNQHPNQHDFDQLATVYSHSDSGTTVRAAAALTSARGVAGAETGGWGRLVEGSRALGHSRYVRDLGNGQRVVTFVTWAR